MEIVLVRHAESTWNAESRWQGQTDVPLSERGRGEAQRLGARLASMTFDRRIASDLLRTGETASAIGGTFERDRAWREIHLGSWEGLLHSEVQERFPADLVAMAEGAPVALGGGESMPGFEARAVAALHDALRTSKPSARVLVVTHGGVIRAIVMKVLGLRARRLFIGAGNTSITHLRADGTDLESVRLVSYNCATHLDLEHSADDEVLRTGEHGDGAEVIRRTALHLGLASDASVRLHPPSAGTSTRLVRGTRDNALRSFATPALSESLTVLEP